MADPLTSDEPYEPDLPPEDVEVVMKSTNGHAHGASQENRLERRLNGKDAAARAEAKALLLSASFDSYTDKLLEIAERMDKGERLSDEEAEWVAGRGLLEILARPNLRPSLRLKAMEQLNRLREKEMLRKLLPAGMKVEPPKLSLPSP